ncbi:hypothetical protein ACLB2K_013787 [Fragaria x ananassa]
MSTKPIKLCREVLLEEIIPVILLKLPVKSLLRFRGVCKSWRSIISSSTFIDTHRFIRVEEELVAQVRLRFGHWPGDLGRVLSASMDIPGDSTWYPKAFLLEPPAFVNGALHWFHNKFKRMFDISSESFSEITMPEFWENKEICLMSSYKEYTLAFFEKEFTYSNGYRLTLWVMEEYGVGDSCARIFTLHDQVPWFRNSGVVLEKSKGGADIGGF